MRIAVLHYQPLEYYPPIMNTLDFLGNQGYHIFRVYTTKSNRRSVYLNEAIKINRFPLPRNTDYKITSLLKQAYYNIFSLLSLVIFRPKIILYYESYSAFPAFIYSRYINKRVKIMIHFHEYSDPEWYEKCMALVKVYHKFEKKYLFKKAQWISHTNADRIRLFHADFPFIEKKVLHELPNFPPKRWHTNIIHKTGTNSPSKIVYIGSLSLESTYIKEFCKWVESKKGDVRFDIYCYNTDKTTYSYLNGIQSDNINFYPTGIDYFDLPLILKRYDIGVILYKANTLNYKYNAPNKLFEYLAANLDVWFSDKMDGTKPYINEFSLPKVLKVDFEKLKSFDYNAAINKSNIKQRKIKFYAEEVNTSLLNEFFI